MNSNRIWQQVAAEVNADLHRSWCSNRTFRRQGRRNKGAGDVTIIECNLEGDILRAWTNDLVNGIHPDKLSNAMETGQPLNGKYYLGVPAECYNSPMARRQTQQRIKRALAVKNFPWTKIGPKMAELVLYLLESGTAPEGFVPPQFRNIDVMMPQRTPDNNPGSAAGGGR